MMCWIGIDRIIPLEPTVGDGMKIQQTNSHKSLSQNFGITGVFLGGF